MDGEDQRQMMKPGDRGSERDDGKVFAKVNMHHIGSYGEDRGDDCRLRSVELAKAPYGESHSYHAGVVSKALKIRRGRRACSQHRLDDAASVECPSKLGSVILHPPYGIEADTLAHERRGGWLENRAEPKHSNPCLLSASHLSKVSRRTPCGVRPMPTLHTTLIRFLPGRREDI